MTKEQIDILVKDGDLIKGKGLIRFHEMEFHWSKQLYTTLEKIFEWYLQNALYGDGFISGSVERFQTKIKTRMNELFLSEEQKKIFLNNKIQEEINSLENLRTNFPWEQTIKDIKESWFCHIVNNKIESLIAVLKFEILEGEKINSFNFPFINLFQKSNLLDEYFLTQSMQEIYEAAAIEENIKFLRRTIASDETDRLINKSIKSNELSINQIALIHFYKGTQITRSNSKEIAQSYGYTSGEKLFQRFTFYSKNSNRIDRPTPCTPRKLLNKIELFKSVIPHLSSNNETRANDEVKILQSHYQTEYE